MRNIPIILHIVCRKLFQNWNAPGWRHHINQQQIYNGINKLSVVFTYKRALNIEKYLKTELLECSNSHRHIWIMLATVLNPTQHVQRAKSKLSKPGSSNTFITEAEEHDQKSADRKQLAYPMPVHTLYQSVHRSLIHIYTSTFTHSYTQNILKNSLPSKCKQIQTIKHSLPHCLYKTRGRSTFFIWSNLQNIAA